MTLPNPSRRISLRRAVAAAAVSLWLSPAGAAAGDAARLAPPQRLLPGLYAAVETATLFTDSKTFADAIPKQTVAVIMRDYRRQQPRSTAALADFVAAHFSLPAVLEPVASATGDMPLVDHIDGLWDTLTRAADADADADAGRRSSLLPLPHPYVVPGGRFRELYYWDSYFTMLGLKQSGRLDLARDMVSDFAYLIDEFGHVPNGTRTYYLSRSQPPFFFLMVALLPDDPDSAGVRYLPQLRREYAYWMRGSQGLRKAGATRRVVEMPDGSLLNRYWDDLDQPRDESYRQDVQLARGAGREPHRLYRDIRAAAESGWDFSSRWLADPRRLSTIDTTEIVPVDLNSLLFGLEVAIGKGCAQLHLEACRAEFGQRAKRRHAAIDRYLWDERSGVYRDYRWTHQRRTPRMSAACVYPLFVGAASPSQAARVAHGVERRLLEPGGIAASSIDTGEQWDRPNGWAPLQWIAVEGLRQYGHSALAATIACRWMQGVEREYRESGKLVEKYDVVDVGHRGGGGEYPTQDGFGWTNGVMRQLMSLYPEADCRTMAASFAEANVK